MKRAELVGELERLGRAPVPRLDDARVAAWEQELLHELPSLDLAASDDLAPPRRHRRPVALAAFGAAAAAVVIALVVHHGNAPGTELHEVSGAVIVLPDGSTMPLHDGDQLPPGGIVETGPNGRLTVGGRTVGPNQLALVDGGRVTPLPRTTAEPAPATSVATAPPAPRTPPTSAATSAVPVATAPRPSATVRTAPASTSAPVAPPTPALVPTTAPPTTAPAPTRAPPPPPAAAPASRVLSLTVTPSADGVHLTWSTPGASSFGRYVVIRASLSLALPKVIGLLPDQSTTSFTDPTPPHGVLVFYRVVAVGPDNHLLAVSRTVSVVLPPSTPAPTSQPPSTMTAASSVPTSGQHGPSTSAPPATASTSTTAATRLTDRADGWWCRQGGPDGGSDGSHHCDGPPPHG